MTSRMACEERNTDKSTGPIFVCGPSRSGTALVRSILNAHSSIHLAGETHYFDDLRPRLKQLATTPLSPELAREAQDYFLALGHRPYGHRGEPEHSRIDRTDLCARASDLGNSGDDYLAAFCSLEAEFEGKALWGEKTPRHVYRVDEMLAAFPNARVICLIRDARAIVASYRDWRNQGGFDLQKDPGHEEALTTEQRRARRSYHPIIISLLWRSAMRAAIEAQRRFGAERVRLQRYESLPTRSEGEIRDLATWLGIEFEEDMASPPMHNSSYDQFQSKAGVSSAPIDRWRNKLTPSEIASIESVCGAVLEELGYDLLRPRGKSLGVTRYWLTFPICAARAALVNRNRIPNLPKYVASRLGFQPRAHRSGSRAADGNPETPKVSQ